MLNLIAILNLRWWIEQDIEAAFVAKTNIASRYVSTGEYIPTRSHIPTRELYDTSGYIDKVKVAQIKDTLRLHLTKEIDALKVDRNFWISDWGIVSGYFGNRKLWALKD